MAEPEIAYQSMNFLFLHLAKTGGLSLRRTLVHKNILYNYDCIHNGMLIEFRDGLISSRKKLHNQPFLQHYDEVFSLVRDPLSRLASCWNYFSHGGLNQYSEKKYFHGDMEFQELLSKEAPTLEQCCFRLDLVAKSIPHFRPMTSWIDQLPEDIRKKMVIGKQERYALDVNACLGRIAFDVDSHKIAHVNQSSVRLSALGLTAAAIASARKYYASDYQRFGY